ncbi:MAG: hypothetical protein ACTHU0_02365 [Kofleriaceae bacterium]
MRDGVAPTQAIAGRAYGHRATLEVAGETLTWRAQRGHARPISENIVTTIHDVADARWIEQRWSVPGTGLVALGAIQAISEGLAWAAAPAAIGAVLVGWRIVRPRRYLVLELGDRRLVLAVDPPCAPHARALAARIDRALATGERPATPPPLP